MAGMRQPVTPTGYTLLGLLSFGRELSGYELKQFADNSLRFFYSSPPMSQVYAEVQRLADAGLVTVREVGPRDTKRYRLSDAGRQQLVEWLEQVPVETPTLKHHVVLRVFLGHLVDPKVLVAQLEAHRQWCDQVVTELTAIQEELGDDANWYYACLAASWGESYYGGERAVAERIATGLREHADKTYEAEKTEDEI